ncbi:putative FKBP-type peptidyl-prolyl isomerase [Terfezia boudieri ATCC MYA-4762]|uniref:peptidylprolyl isomerase n=1 Tax=Terfezia boudieri ATCC MYA-4762 TaxID=1051890 RepID=A0A3N4LFC9_9PEZI|nr:putative FKBP-type peptidyl-prolyl isomerase [Terfezia boudieri ATCC MYA-4762]
MQFKITSVASLLFLGLVAADELKIEKTLEIPCERKTRKGYTIEVHYRGTLESDGTQFDASYDRGQPFKFTLGQGRVIKGWDEGLLDMCIGEKRKLTIPYQYAYGEKGMPPVIPPKATLIFETELVAMEGSGHEDL